MQKTTNEFIRLLEADGWYLHRSAKHRIFRHPTKTTLSGRPMAVSHGNKEIKSGTWHNMMKDAGLAK